MDEYQGNLCRVKEILKNHPQGMTIKQIADELGVNRNTTAKYLNVLEISGRVEKRQFGPAKVYTLAKRTPISKILNFSTDYVLVIDKNNVIHDINDNFLEFIGMKREKVLKRKLEEINCPFFEKLELTSEIERMWDKKNSVTETENEIDGKKSYFRNKLIPTTFEDGDIGITLIIEDITKQKKAKKLLKRSKEKIEELHDVAVAMERCRSEEEVYQLIIDAADKILEYDICPVLIAEGDMLKVKLNSPGTPPGGGKDIPIHDGIAGKTYREKKSYLVPNIKKIKEADPSVEEYRSAISVPIGDLGVFQAISTSFNAFDQEDLKTTELLISHASEALKRIRSRRALERNEEKYRTVFENTGNATAMVEKDGTLSLVNKEFEKLSGYTKEKIEGKKKWKEFVFEEDIERMEKYNDLRKKNPEKAPKSYEFRFVSRKGKVHDVLLYIDAIRGTNKFVGSIVDMTELKKAEENLWSERIQLVSIFDSMYEFICIIDPKTFVILYANKELRETIGKDPIGNRCYDELQVLGCPCKSCREQRVLQEEEEYQEQYYNSILDSNILITQHRIEWPERDVKLRILAKNYKKGQEHHLLKSKVKK